MKLVQREATGCLKQHKEATDLLSRVFARRNINHEKELDLSLKNLHPVSQLKGIDTATRLIVDTIEASKKIIIIGDFDADGASATAVAMRAFQQMGHQDIEYLVPNRFEYGYGLTPEIVDEAAKRSPQLIITVDNGISSIKGVAQAKKLGIQVIITDHHLPAKQLPIADAIVNPNQKGCPFPSKHLAGVGVIFYLMLSVKHHLQSRDYFALHQRPIPNLTELLDVVALGTVADVVPLDHNNRILVEQGLRRMRSGQACAGIQALFSVANRNIRHAVSADLGFACGPRLNAAGRLEDMSLGITCLLSHDLVQARSLAIALDDLNLERRAIEDKMKEEALTLLAELDDDKLSGELPSVICLYQATWHQGVIGILAARVRERYHRPTIIFAPADTEAHVDDIQAIKGSARSIPSLHIRDILDEVASTHPDLLEKFGGHAMAAGLSLEASRLDEFSRAICDIVDKQVTEETFQEIQHSDGKLDIEDFELQCANDLRFAAPWGQHFPAPVFDNQFLIVNKRLLKEKHYKLLLRTCGNDQQHRTLQAIAFNVNPDDWPEEGQEVHLLYRLDVNEFRGDASLQLMVEKLL